jgi:hypothetical protein
MVFTYGAEVDLDSKRWAVVEHVLIYAVVRKISSLDHTTEMGILRLKQAESRNKMSPR